MPSGTLLFIAEPQAVTGLFSRLKESGYEAGLADNLTGALNFIKKSNPCLVITRPRLQTYKAEDLLAQKGAAAQFPPVIVFAKFGSAEDAQRYLELGAKDYWLDPLQWEKIKLLLPAPEPESDEDEDDAPEPAPRAARPANPGSVCHHRGAPGGEAGAGPGPAGGAVQGHGAYCRGERHGQGDVRPLPAFPQRPGGQVLHRHQLRGPAGTPARIRTLRP